MVSQEAEGPVGSIAETSSVDSESCWGEMEDLIGEEKVEWGLLPCPAAPAVQSSIVVVEALERDLLELPESNKHKVDQDASGAASTSPFRQRVPTVTVRNRFAELAQEEIFDPDSGGALLQREAEMVTESDTESCEEVQRPSRRLRLMWNREEIPQSVDSDQRLAASATN